MITIEKGAKVMLPKEYHFANNICAHLYDHITEILTDSYYSEMHSTAIVFGEDEELKKRFNDKKEHALDILKSSNRNDELEIVLTKHIVMSIISDMVNFIYESIIIAQKGKMSVAFSLVRKPFTDQLLILEQILVDRKDFINRFFHQGNPENYDPSSNKMNKKEIIKNALSKLRLSVFDPELIFELRYDKSKEMGINWISNHALHVVTNDKNYKTKDQNLNFVFSGQKEMKTYWDHYFLTIPILLTYTASVVDKIIFEIVKNKDDRRELKHLQRFIGFTLVVDDRNKSKFLISSFQALSKMLITECPICKNKNKFKKEDFKLFFYEQLFLCSKCFNSINLSADSIISLSNIFDKG